jgi:hypothetical protein
MFQKPDLFPLSGEWKTPTLWGPLKELGPVIGVSFF